MEESKRVACRVGRVRNRGTLMQTRMMYAAVLGGMALWAGLAQAAQPQAVAKPQMARLHFTATVQADGTLADVQPDAALPEAFKSMIRRGVAKWRYTPAQWQGKSAAAPVSQVITVEVTTVANGFAFRIVAVGAGAQSAGAAQLNESVAQAPPMFPPELMRRGVNAILVYSVHYDEAGKPQRVERVHPGTVDADHKQLDAATREAMANWSVTHTFDGAPITCRTKVPVTFQTGDAEPMPVPAEIEALFARYTDMCPAPVLQTPVAGTFL